MIKYKKGFTLIEVILAIAIFSMVAVVIFSLFMSNYLRIEAQSRETYLQEEIDRGLIRLSDRLMGTCEILNKEDTGFNTEFMSFKYYYKDSTTPYEGELSLEKSDGLYILKLKSKPEGEDTEVTNTLMSFLKRFKMNFINENGAITSRERACALEINYTVTTSYKKIVKEKEGKLTIKLRNIRSKI